MQLKSPWLGIIATMSASVAAVGLPETKVVTPQDHGACLEFSLTTRGNTPIEGCMARWTEDQSPFFAEVVVESTPTGGRFCLQAPDSLINEPARLARAQVEIECSAPIQLAGVPSLEEIPSSSALMRVSALEIQSRDDDPKVRPDASRALYSEAISVSSPYATGGRPGRELLTEGLVSDSGESVSATLERQSNIVALPTRGQSDELWIRGAGSRLISTQIDGERIPSLLAGRRTAGLAAMPVDLFSGIQVQTTFVAAKDSDAIGGVIDLRTPNSKGSSPTMVRASLGGGDLDNRGSTGVSARFNRSWQDDRLWWSGGVSARAEESRTDALETRVEDSSLNNKVLLESEDLRVHDFDRRRLAGIMSGKFASRGGRLNVGSQSFSSHGRTGEVRKRTEFLYSEDTVKKELKEALDKDRLSSLRLEADGLLTPGFLLSGHVMRLDARAWQPRRIDTGFHAPLDEPGVSGESSFGFLLEEVQLEDDRSNDRSSIAAVNAAISLDHLSSGQSLFQELTFGLKAREKSRSRDANSGSYLLDDDVGLDSAQSAHVGPTLFRGERPLGPVIAPGYGAGYLGSDLPFLKSFEEDAADFSAREKNVSAFTQAVLQGAFGELVIGARYDDVTASYSGFEVIRTEDGSQSRLDAVPGSRSYGALLPSASWTRPIGSLFEISASAARSFSSPDYGDLVPYLLVDAADQELERGNSKLVETTAWNYDVTGILRRQGFRLLGSMFWKELTHPIVTSVTEELFQDEPFEARMPINADNGQLRGLELEASKSFAWQNGGRLTLELSGVLTGSTQQLSYRDDTQRLINQADAVVSVAVTVTKHRWTTVLGAKHVGDSVWEVGDSATADVWLSASTRAYASLKVDLPSSIVLSLKAENLFDEDLDFRQGNARHPWLRELSGRRLSFGFTRRF